MKVLYPSNSYTASSCQHNLSRHKSMKQIISSICGSMNLDLPRTSEGRSGGNSCINRQATSCITNDDLERAKMIQFEKDKALKKEQYQQIMEKEQLRRARILVDKELQEDADNDSAFYEKCSELERKARLDELYRIQEFNVLMARRKKVEETSAKMNDRALNMAHMYNVLTSDLMLESSDGAISALGEGRLRRDQFKGMSDAEIARIKATQLKQIAERKELEKGEELLAKRFTCVESTWNRELLKDRLVLEKERRQLLLKLQEENLRLAAKQSAAQVEAQSRARDNIPTEEFFNQFGRGLRNSKKSLE